MAPVTASAAPHSAPASVLVIDDEPDLRTLYELTLLREGYRIDTAGSLAEAREQLQSRSYDVIISDMRLPDGLGLELLQWVWAEQRCERCIVLCDSSKFERKSVARVCKLAQIGLLVTDAAPPPALAAALERAGVQVMVV